MPATATDLALVAHWIDGKEQPGTSGRIAPVFDPALGTVSKNVSLADQAEIATAIASAKAAFPAWRDMSIAKRQQVLFSFRELLNARKGELAGRALLELLTGGAPRELVLPTQLMVRGSSGRVRG